MTFWRIAICGRRLCGKRRFVFGVVLASLSFVGYLMLLTPSGKLVRDDYPLLSDAAPDCHCSTRQQTHQGANKTVITSSEETLAEARKVKQDLSNMSYVYGLTVHVWSELCGNTLDHLRNWPHFPYFPDKSYSISNFYKIQIEDLRNNGERIFGYVHPPRSGPYKFAVTSDGTTELWLSPNEDPASSEMIARVSSYPERNQNEEEYEKYPGQISKEITLQAGKKYFIESLSKQSSGGPEHIAVYWSNSSSKSTFEIISSEYLSNFAENRDGNIPSHAQKQTKILIEGKGEIHDFIRFPFINRREYVDKIPSCSYRPSFLVRKKLEKYEGVWLPKLSHVFPDDDTAMLRKTSLNNKWSTANLRVNRSKVEAVVHKFMAFLQPWNFFLKKVKKVIHKPDPKNGDRFLLNLELGLENTNQSMRLSEHVYLQKDKDTLCLPEGMNWNNNATVYFILPVKDQGKWVHYFISQLTDASLLTGDTNFQVIVVDFESKDIDMPKAFNTSLLRSRHTIVPLTGKFYKTLAINKAAELVPNPHDIIFLFDLHIDVPADIMNSVRMNTIVGRMAYFPIVGRLDCGSSADEHQGFWQLDGYGIMSIYKSDWDRFGGMNTKEYRHKWGGEDWDLVDRVLMLPVEVERIKYPGLYHYYHSKRKMWN